MAMWTRVCFYCKCTFEAAHTLANICSPDCQQAARATRVRAACSAPAAAIPARERPDQAGSESDGLACPRCGALVHDATGLRKYCSRACRRAALRNRRKAMIRRAYVEPVSLAVLRTRDADTCRICGRPVDFTKQSPDPNSATIDHVVALARGGEHSYENTQLAHLRCNSEKGSDGPALSQQVTVAFDEVGWASGPGSLIASGEVSE